MENIFVCDGCKQSSISKMPVSTNEGEYCSQECAELALANLLARGAADRGLLSFEQFQATKKDVESLSDLDPDWSDPGLVYADALHIVKTDLWESEFRLGGKFYLVIGNMEWQSDDLESLERHLYRFYVMEH